MFLTCSEGSSPSTLMPVICTGVGSRAICPQKLLKLTCSMCTVSLVLVTEGREGIADSGSCRDEKGALLLVEPWPPPAIDNAAFTKLWTSITHNKVEVNQLLRGNFETRKRKIRKLPAFAKPDNCRHVLAVRHHRTEVPS